MADGGLPRRITMAQRADRHDLYEKSVQSAGDECAFVLDTFRRLRKRSPRILREDFCGTASVACHWVRLDRQNRAIGVDLDPEVLDWGLRRHGAALTPGQRQRLDLLQADVTRARTVPADVVVAFNFSYWVFKTRPQMVRYFRRARQALAEDGIFMLDAFGGSDAYREMRETTPFPRFTYVWHQEKYRPVTGEILCHIGFRFPDGSRLDKAFTYDWRIWSLPEITEMLAEAGFRRSTVWWEGTTEDGEGNGEFAPEEQGEADAAWVAYIVAER